MGTVRILPPNKTKTEEQDGWEQTMDVQGWITRKVWQPRCGKPVDPSQDPRSRDRSHPCASKPRLTWDGHRWSPVKLITFFCSVDLFLSFRKKWFTWGTWHFSSPNMNHCQPQPAQETRQYLIWDREGEETTVDHVTTNLFEAAERDPSRGRSRTRMKKGKKTRKGDKTKGSKRKRKGSTKSSSSKSSSPDSSAKSSSSSSSGSEAHPSFSQNS